MLAVPPSLLRHELGELGVGKIEQRRHGLNRNPGKPREPCEHSFIGGILHNAFRRRELVD
jgi:hypothetical protein